MKRFLNQQKLYRLDPFFKLALLQIDDCEAEQRVVRIKLGFDRPSKSKRCFIQASQCIVDDSQLLKGETERLSQFAGCAYQLALLLKLLGQLKALVYLVSGALLGRHNS